MNDNEKLIEEARKYVSDHDAYADNHLLRDLADALEAAEKAYTPTNGSCWDAAPRIIRAGVHDPMQTVCELTAGHLGAHRAGQTEWMHSPAPVPSAPTDDEREALLSALREEGFSGSGEEIGTHETVIFVEHVPDIVLALGFRRSEVPESSAEAMRDHVCWSLTLRPAQDEPSDAQVEAAAQAMFEPDGPDGDYTWAEMVVEDVSRADIWREDARKVLRAAGGVR